MGHSFRTLLAVALLVGGCKRSDEGWSGLGDVFGVPNLDDDDGNRDPDWKDAPAEGDNDLAPLSLAGLSDGMRKHDTLVLELGGDIQNLRVWVGGEPVLDEDAVVLRADRESVPPELAVEFGDYGVGGTLTVRLLDKKDREVQSKILRLQAAPLVLNHHLQPFEKAFAVHDSGYNDEMIEVIDGHLGRGFTHRPVSDYGFDVWVQDEFETGTLVSPTSRIDVVIDSIRRGEGDGLDDYPEKVVARGDDTLVQTWGKGIASSQDSFGNLEVSPPVTVDGVHYPFGRIYYGEWTGGTTIHDRLTGFLADQRVQAPFTLDVTWLCVGHVDEFTTFLPDPTAPKGYRLFVSDVPSAWKLLESLDPSTELPRYDQGHGFATIGDMVDDGALRALNEDFQRDYIDRNVDTLKAELGLDDADIVRVPGLFEEIGACGPFGLALIPGTVNMLVATAPDGTVSAFLPDPFLRTVIDDQASDPFIAAVNDLLPDNVTPYWVDDWFGYHLAWGEVHCGTNTIRTPTTDWWTDAMHLLGEE